MAFKSNSTPWNKGKRGVEAGWTEERRRHQSRLQREFMRANPGMGFAARSGPQVWKTGPDPEVRQHYYRFLKARAQARFWQQEWTIIWEDYLDLYKTAPGRWGGRDANALHLARRDTTQGWHIWNVHVVNRGESMRRSTRGKKRITPAGLGSKARGINWRRGGHTRNDT